MTSLEASEVARSIMTSLSSILSGILSESLLKKAVFSLLKKTLAYVLYLIKYTLLHIIYSLYFYKMSNVEKFAQHLHLDKENFKRRSNPSFKSRENLTLTGLCYEH
jgi:cellulose synthase/poly-beta-1,6-N-acetylglucosamine synthase-like glycosyltransferase